MKIVYCTDSVCYPGGIQRITIAKANALAEIEGNEVWIVVTDNKLPNPVLPISGKVHFVDLDVNYYEDDWKSKFHVLKGILVKRRVHRNRLTSFLESVRPDVVISTGTSEKHFLPKLQVSSRPVYIREIHFTSNYRRLHALGFWEKAFAWVGDFIDYQFTCKKYDRVAVLTREDKQLHWKNNHNIVVMPNPLTIHHLQRSSLTNKTVIAAGRLAHQKNFASLINAWTLVHQQHPDWKLEIWGDGGLRNELQRQIEELHLEKSALLMGYTNDVISKYAEASIFVLSSLFEGFGLVIIEAMSCGLPVVSYACPTGPKDIITEGKDGYLVPVGDEKLVAERISYLIEHGDVRQAMGAAALEKSKQYEMDSIIDQWMKLFNDLLKEKSNEGMMNK